MFFFFLSLYDMSVFLYIQVGLEKETAVDVEKHRDGQAGPEQKTNRSTCEECFSREKEMLHLYAEVDK